MFSVENQEIKSEVTSITSLKLDLVYCCCVKGLPKPTQLLWPVAGLRILLVCREVLELHDEPENRQLATAPIFSFTRCSFENCAGMHKEFQMSKNWRCDVGCTTNRTNDIPTQTMWD